MRDIGFIYKCIIALACLILMLASIACTGWFFYSWFGGIPGMIGASVGCAIQLMAYGFSGVVVHNAKGLLRFILVVLIASTLSLSVLSSYATLTGYFSALQQDTQAKIENEARKAKAIDDTRAQRMKLMDLMSRDVSIGSSAADQGLSESYRTQANQFLDKNVNTRTEMANQIEKMEARISADALAAQRRTQGSPIDGLSTVLGGENSAIMILCLWLAIMFDALPIAGITLLEARYKKQADDGDFIPETHSELNIQYTTDNPQEPGGSILLAEQAHNKDDLRIITNICTLHLSASKEFYLKLLNMEVKYESDWYIQLCSAFDSKIEFGLIQYDHDLIPPEYRKEPTGMYITFIVPDVNEVYDNAVSESLDILQKPKDEFYGQRRFLLKDPSGCLVDVCSPSIIS